MFGIVIFIYFDNEEFVLVIIKNGLEVEKFMKIGKFDLVFLVLIVINYKKYENFLLKFLSGFWEIF